jgi:hypothetical protein
MVNIIVRTSVFHRNRNPDPIRVTTREISLRRDEKCWLWCQYATDNRSSTSLHSSPTVWRCLITAEMQQMKLQTRETRLPSNSHEGCSNYTRMRDQFWLLRLHWSDMIPSSHFCIYSMWSYVSMHAFQSDRLQAPAALPRESPEYEAV